MAELRVPIPDDFQEQFNQMLTNVAREAIATAKEQELNHGKEWMNQKEVCEWLDISYGTLQSWRVKGLKVSSIGRITLISKEEVNRFLREQQN